MATADSSNCDRSKGCEKLNHLIKKIKLSEKTEQVLDIPSTPSASHHQMQAVQSVKAQAQFSCDGREHCSQMHSREEAIFFLRNCPNTKMDGDNDGEPCEQQF